MRHTCGHGLTGEGPKSNATRPVPLRMRNGLPLNNNRNQNQNRRRGRGNRNQGGGGNQGNRIDSRARGNAPQLLDKYKKLAEDAHRNGDRVQAEYYLQFADHYFRVIADNRTRQEEPRGDQRMGRRDEREQDDFDTEDGGDGEDQRRFENRDREDRGRDDRNRDGRDREARRERPRREFRREEQGEGAEVVEASEGPSFEPEDNPFTRDVREPREPRDERPKRRATRPRRESSDERVGIDVAALPPAFSAPELGNEPGNDTSDGEETAKAVPRPRRKRSDGGTLSAVG